MSADDRSNYDSLMTVHDLINALYDTGDQNAKVFLGITAPDGNNPRTKCSIRAVHGDAWKLPAVELVGQPLSDEKPAYDEDVYRDRADLRNLLTILRGLTDDMDEQEGGDTHIAGHTVRFVRDMARRVK